MSATKKAKRPAVYVNRMAPLGNSVKRMLLAMLAYRASPDGYVDTCPRVLSNATEIGYRTLMRLISELERDGVVEVTPEGDLYLRIPRISSMRLRKSTTTNIAPEYPKPWKIDHVADLDRNET